jgi:hypothetical protein
LFAFRQKPFQDAPVLPQGMVYIPHKIIGHALQFIIISGAAVVITKFLIAPAFERPAAEYAGPVFFLRKHIY